MRSTLNTRTAAVETSTTMSSESVNRTTGPMTSFLEWLRIRLQVGAEKTSSRRMGQADET